MPIEPMTEKQWQTLHKLIHEAEWHTISPHMSKDQASERISEAIHQIEHDRREYLRKVDPTPMYHRRGPSEPGSPQRYTDEQMAAISQRVLAWDEPPARPKQMRAQPSSAAGDPVVAEKQNLTSVKVEGSTPGTPASQPPPELTTQPKAPPPPPAYRNDCRIPMPPAPDSALATKEPIEILLKPNPDSIFRSSICSSNKMMRPN
jgi:hypothetical protein